ncbi:sirohydrochlorin chelatase [Undibacterium umbellatum]|uniref:CbiX/SirB N-terminal domain-containing protein n=1 Tax=Undibacterium umbellatum TaxID=2762300 RepID=A0ABR6Z5G6_9BURK|nr:CbiX/SirB N-terminal domain-containing protein [Undibacterium umbellatum]MBC3906571.1 CbiX/SirB N-terminal domain-containing protein [Undibacterium umbellatum]
MANKSALILFAHGARDPRWATPFQRLQAMTQASLPDVTVALAFLEFMTPSLPELAAQLVADGCENITLAPVFLGQGGHVLRDLPVLAEEIRAAHPGLQFKTVSAVGEDEAVLKAIRDYCLKLL